MYGPHDMAFVAHILTCPICNKDLEPDATSMVGISPSAVILQILDAANVRARLRVCALG